MVAIHLTPTQLTALTTSLLMARDVYLLQAESQTDPALAESLLASASEALALVQEIWRQRAQISRIEGVNK